MAVVTHDDDERIVGNPQLLHFVEDFTNPPVKQLHFLNINTTVCSRVFFSCGARAGQRIERPILQEERLILFSKLAQVLHGLLLVAHVHLVVFGLGPALTGCVVNFTNGLAALALNTGHHGAGIGTEPFVFDVLVVIVVLADTDRDLFVGGIIMEDRQLPLLVDGERGIIEALMIRPGFHDVTHVPFADVDSFVTNLRQNLGNRHFLVSETKSGDIHRGVAHAVAMGLAAGHKGDARRGTGRFRVHPREAHAFISKFIDVGCFVAANSVQLCVTQISETDIVDQYIKDVRRLAVVFLFEICKLLVNSFVVSSPLFTVLRFEDVVLGVVNDLFTGGKNRGYRHQTIDD